MKTTKKKPKGIVLDSLGMDLVAISGRRKRERAEIKDFLR
jgi:hypothetical protein